MGELAAKNENFIWNSYDNDLYQNNPEDETIGELNEKIYAAIRYMIRWNNSEGGSFSVDGTSKYGEYDVAQGKIRSLGLRFRLQKGTSWNPFPEEKHRSFSGQMEPGR